MDLAVEAERLRLDVLAVRLSAALRGADVPHAVIKGPTTACWLSDEPRAYRDVDLLVPWRDRERAVAALERAGVARRGAGRLGEEAGHSLLLSSTEGFEVDLHVAFPAMTPVGDLLWDLVAGGLQPFDLGVGTVPALDPAARCVVLALHAAEGHPGGQAHADLVQARERVDGSTWRDAADLAHRLGVEDLFAAGLTQVDPTATTGPSSRRAYLRVAGAPPAALGLDRLLAAPARARPLLAWREVVPSRGFMHRAHPTSAEGSRQLAAAHVQRWRHLARQLPGAVRALRDYRGRDRPGTRDRSASEQGE